MHVQTLMRVLKTDPAYMCAEKSSLMILHARPLFERLLKQQRIQTCKKIQKLYKFEKIVNSKTTSIICSTHNQHAP